MVPRKISNSYYMGVLYHSVILVDLLFKTKPHYKENLLCISALCEDPLYITLCEDDVFLHDRYSSTKWVKTYDLLGINF